MRTRPTKHTFWKSVKIGQCNFVARLLLKGLWAMADRRGLLEYSPLKIKVEVFPFDDSKDVDIEGNIKLLEKVGLISLYTVNGKKYIQCPDFEKHARPHKDEKPDLDIPEPISAGTSNGFHTNGIKDSAPGDRPVAPGENRGIPGENPVAPGDRPGVCSDSSLLVPDCYLPTTDNQHAAPRPVNQSFDRLKAADVAKRIVEAYRADVSSNGMASEARNTVVAALEHDPLATEADLRHAMASYLADCESEGTERKYRIGAAKFFAGEWREYLSREPRSPPQKAITIESVAEINRREAEVIERLMS